MTAQHLAVLSSLRQISGQQNAEIIELYPGIALTFLRASGDRPLHFCHDPLEDVLIVHYCISGRIDWGMGGEPRFTLSPGDVSIHRMDAPIDAAVDLPSGAYQGIVLAIALDELTSNPPALLEGTHITGELLREKYCRDRAVDLPSGAYQGIVLAIALDELTSNPPALLEGTHITGELLREKYCRDRSCTVLTASESLQQIFRALYQPPKDIQLAYRKIKVLELLIQLSRLDSNHEMRLSEYQTEQVEVIRQIHDQLTQNLGQRCSIEALSKQYLMNPTTLKTMFKAVYGKSIAAHIREHRMEYAAQLLRSSNMKALSKQYLMNPTTLKTMFKAVYGKSIAAHIREHRMEYAAQLLRSSNMKIADIAVTVGYDSQSRFSSVFKEHYQMLPKEYRKKYIGEL